MKRHIKKDDLDVVLAMLAYAAKSRNQIMTELWFHPSMQYAHLIKGGHKEVISGLRSKIFEEQYRMLSSELMRDRFPLISKIVKYDVSMQQKCAMILITIGMPVPIIADITMVAAGRVRIIMKEYPELFK